MDEVPDREFWLEAERKDEILSRSRLANRRMWETDHDDEDDADG